MIKGELITGDFEENTMTFEIEGEMILKAGRYIILTEEEYSKSIEVIEPEIISKNINN